MDIRRATEDDIRTMAAIFVASCGDLIERFEPQDRHLLPLDPETRLPMSQHLVRTGRSFIAEEEGEAVGFASVIIREDLWYLSQLWVMPGRQGAGVGSTLIDRALAESEGASTFAVVASVHPSARTLYLRRSMFPMWDLVELSGTGGGQAPIETRPLTDDDQPWIDELDRATFGAARPQDHAWWRVDGEGVSLQREGAPIGYVYVSSSWSGDGKHIGPGAVAAASDTALLVQVGLSVAGDAKVDVHVPAANWAAVHELIQRGFRWSEGNLFMASRPLGDATRYIASGGALG